VIGGDEMWADDDGEPGRRRASPLLSYYMQMVYDMHGW
jgi:hypothetical protein